MTISQKIDDLTAHLKDYVDTNVDLVKLQAIEKSSSFGARLMAMFVLAGIGMIALVFLSLWGSFFLSEWIGHPYAGFGIVSAIYVVIFVLMMGFRKKAIESPVRDVLIKGAMQNEFKTDES